VLLPAARTDKDSMEGDSWGADADAIRRTALIPLSVGGHHACRRELG
jgi:hypothetical protein